MKTTKKTTPKIGNKTQVAKGLLWLYAAVFFTATAILVFKAYEHYITTAIALQQLAIAIAIVVTKFIKAEK